MATECVQVSPGSNLPAAKGLPEGNYLLLEVSDNGSGMTPETLRKAFDPFFTTKFAGRGMGLAVVQQIVRGLGGAIHVASSMAEGTSIQIMLPCATQPVTTTGGHTAARVRHAEVQTQPAAHHPGGRRRGAAAASGVEAASAQGIFGDSGQQRILGAGVNPER